MKTKLKNFTTLDKIIFSFYGIAVVLFIASVIPTLNCVAYRWDFILLYVIRFIPYLVLGVISVFSNKYNVRRLVSINFVFLAICFFISMITEFNIMHIHIWGFINIDNTAYYVALIFAISFIAGICSHCSNRWIYFYGCAMIIISFARVAVISIKFDEIGVQLWFDAFSVIAYFSTLIAVAERFSEDNKYTNLCDKIFADIDEELYENPEDNSYHIHNLFQTMAAKSIDNEHIFRYCDFYETLKNSDFISLQEKGFLNKDFIAEFCGFVSEYLDENESSKPEIVLNNIAKILMNKDTNEDTYKRELLNLCYLFSKDLIVNPVNCADKIDIRFKSDNETAKALSNYAQHPFEMNGVQINSIESFLQSLKFKSKRKQIKICQFDGKAAKIKGKHHNLWKLSGGNLYWQGKKINRFSKEYQNLLTKAYFVMFESNIDSKNTLLSTVDSTGVQKLFQHSIGQDNPQDTILTTDEFLDRLYALRKYFINNKENENDRFKEECV